MNLFGHLISGPEVGCGRFPESHCNISNPSIIHLKLHLKQSSRFISLLVLWHFTKMFFWGRRELAHSQHTLLKKALLHPKPSLNLKLYVLRIVLFNYFCDIHYEYKTTTSAPSCAVYKPFKLYLFFKMLAEIFVWITASVCPEGICCPVCA